MYIVTQSVCRCVNVIKGYGDRRAIDLLIRKKRYEKLLQQSSLVQLLLVFRSSNKKGGSYAPEKFLYH